MVFIRNYKLSFLSLSLLLILFSTKVFSSHHHHKSCPPSSSSCGTIQNISYPFRWKGDPKNCGEPFFELTCENNNVTTVYLNSKRFIVKSITYHNFTIRLLDPGYSSSSCPLHFLTHQDFEYYSSSSYDEYYTDDEYYGGSYINMWLTYVSCSSYININTTNKSNENYYHHYYYEAPGTTACCFDSHFPAENYSYIVYGQYSYRIRDLKNSCKLKRASMVSKKASAAVAAAKDGLVGGVGNYTQLLPDYTYGFELLWYPILMERRNARGEYSCFANMENGTVVCAKFSCVFSLSRRGLSTLHDVNCLKQYFHGMRQTLLLIRPLIEN